MAKKHFFVMTASATKNRVACADYPIRAELTTPDTQQVTCKKCQKTLCFRKGLEKKG